MTTIVNKRVLKDIFDGVANLRREFGIYIAPEVENMYLVHFILPGPEDTPFEGGLYHGLIRLNNNHPLGAPNLYMYTPSGRFETMTHPIPASKRGICTTDTSFHPETWSPVKNIETVLKGFISLMCDKYDGAVGSVKSTDAQTRTLAKASLTCIKNDRVVMTLFPELHAQVANGTYTPVKLGELCNTTHTPVPEPIEEAEPEPEVVEEEPVTKTKPKSKSKAKPAPKTKSATKTKTKRKVIFESSSESESSELIESEEESLDESSEPELKPRKKSSKAKVSTKVPTKVKAPAKSKKETKDTKGKSSTKAKTASKDKKAATKSKK